jgi:hypothetical protein
LNTFTKIFSTKLRIQAAVFDQHTNFMSDALFYDMNISILLR